MRANYIQEYENVPKIISVLNYQQYEYDLNNRRLNADYSYFPTRMVKKDENKPEIKLKLNYKTRNIKKI